MELYPSISLIAAVDKERHIGLNGDMPWGRDQSADLNHFKKLTQGRTLIMGRKTFESLPFVLPGRKHLVLTKSVSFIDHPMVEVHDSVESILETISYHHREVGTFPKIPEEVMVIGGAQVYELFFPYASTIYLTTIHASYEGDTVFPNFSGRWSLNHDDIVHLSANERNKHSMTFQTFRRAW